MSAHSTIPQGDETAQDVIARVTAANGSATKARHKSDQGIHDDMLRRRTRRLAVSERDLPHDERPFSRHDRDELVQRLRFALDLAEALPLRPEPGKYGADVIARDPNGYPEMLTELDPARTAAILWGVLEDIDYGIPEVEGWAVVKTSYHSTDGPEGRTSVWTLHTSKEQAEAFAPAIAAHYARKASHTSDAHPERPGIWGGWTDRWSVVWTTDSIRDMIGPDCTPEAYTRGLGS